MKTSAQIANEILDVMLSKMKAWEVRRATVSSDGFADLRNWGIWENPKDMPEDEDENDYDWQVLSEVSTKMLEAILEDFLFRYPNHDIRISAEEKNWISIKVSEKE